MLHTSTTTNSRTIFHLLLIRGVQYTHRVSIITMNITQQQRSRLKRSDAKPSSNNPNHNHTIPILRIDSNIHTTEHITLKTKPHKTNFNTQLSNIQPYILYF